MRAVVVGLVTVAAFSYALLHPGSSRADSLPCESPYHGFDFDTFELENYKTQYATAIELAAAGKAVPAPYTLSTGESIDVRYYGLKSGPRSVRLPETTARPIPPSIFKSIIWIESTWSNATGKVPYGGVGPLIVSGDCGYGLGQITSGMGHLGGDALEPGVPSARQAIIGTDFLFNLAEGARILAGKWNSAPAARPIAGQGDPAMLEDWYYAIWSYNGFAFSNHPLNPNLDPLRGGGTAAPVFHCNDPAAPGYQVLSGGGQKYQAGNYTYPERIYGCMRYPPKTTSSGATAAEAGPKFVAGDVAVVAGTGDCLVVHTAPGRNTPRIVPDPGGCIPDGSPVTILEGPQATSGAVAGNYTWWKVKTSIGAGWVAEDFLTKLGAPPAPVPVDPANRLWPPQVFSMPNLAIEAVASAFKPQNYTACANSDTPLTDCAAMDFPTAIPAANPPVTPHPDTTSPVDPTQAAAFIRDPQIQYSGPASVSFDGATAASAASTQITVKNVGSGIAPFRIRTSADWIVVRHPGDPPVRTLDGGVAIGSETDVVTQAPSGTTPRVAQKGYQSVLLVTINPALMPPGTSVGKVWIEPLLGGGGVYVLNVTGTKGTVIFPWKAVVPGISGDGSP